MLSLRKIRVENESELLRAGIGIYDVHELQTIAKTLHTLDEHSCNGYYSERAEKAADTRAKNLEARADIIASKYGKSAYHQSDPRGWSLYLVDSEQLRTAQARDPRNTIDAMYNSLGIAVCPH